MTHGIFAHDDSYEAFRHRLMKSDAKHFKFLTDCEMQAIRVAQQYLLLDAEDIRFRAYDLLFTCYPALRAALPTNRYIHPDIVSLLYSNRKRFAIGIDAAECLLAALSPVSERDLIDSVSLIKQCLLKALRDVLFDELSPNLLQIYSKILEQRMIDLLKTNNQKRHSKEHCSNLRSAVP